MATLVRVKRRNGLRREIRYDECIYSDAVVGPYIPVEPDRAGYRSDTTYRVELRRRMICSKCRRFLFQPAGRIH